MTADEEDDGEQVADPWETPLEVFGSYLRAQRRLANLSLREMAERTNLSNAYLSQIERGLHAPSVRVLRAVARGLDLTTEAMLVQAGLIDPDSASESESGSGDAAGARSGEPLGASRTEAAIRHDPRITDEQKEALLSVYRTYLAVNGHA